MATKPASLAFLAVKKGDAAPTTPVLTHSPEVEEQGAAPVVEPSPTVTPVIEETVTVAPVQAAQPKPRQPKQVRVVKQAPPIAEQMASRLPTGQHYHKALTLKLDEERYKALKMAGLMQGATSQDILVEALDLWLLKQDEQG